MALFSIEDSLVKLVAQTVSISQILVIFGLGGALVFAGVAKLHGEPLYSPAVVSAAMQVRVLFEITGRLFYVLAISLTALSASTLILQATPLVVVAGAALFFGEKVGVRRWSAIVVGLLGVIIIIGPGTESFSTLSILAVIGMLGFAGRDLASRAAPVSLSTAILGLYGFLSVVVAGLLFALWERKPWVAIDAHVALCLVAAIAMGSAAYACLMKAMRTGEVSAVTPLRYTRLLFGVALGILVFGEPITVTMVLGSSLIVASGLFTLWRGNQVHSGDH